MPRKIPSAELQRRIDQARTQGTVFAEILALAKTQRQMIDEANATRWRVREAHRAEVQRLRAEAERQGLSDTRVDQHVKAYLEGF